MKKLIVLLLMIFAFGCTSIHYLPYAPQHKPNKTVKKMTKKQLRKAQKTHTYKKYR